VALARAGADVAIVDLNEAAGQQTADEIRSLGRQSLFVACDVTQKDQVQAMVQRVAAQFGRLVDLLVGAQDADAGIVQGDVQAAWDKVIAVNLTGVFLCAQAEAQQFLRQSPVDGKIINIASMSATICNCNASYNGSKAGVVQMTRMLAAEWGRFNINVNCISPSYVLTPMHASTPVVVRQRIRELTPLGHVQRPEDLYGAAIFLASAASNYVTGHDLMVDGGHTLNAWLTPLGRSVPPRVSPEEETVQLKHDLQTLGLPYDADGINPTVHPEIADAFKAAFGV
jgi:NAD(P)-dependent dehydrogenase (short-subunit alcohol dehydrogenase family)